MVLVKFLFRVIIVLSVPLLGFLCTALRADDVYALSFTTGELIHYDSSDPAGTRTTVLTGGSLYSPASLVMGPDGNLYIGENGDGSSFAPRISKFEPATLTLSTVFAFSDFSVFPGSLVFQGNDLLIGRNPEFSNTGPIVKLSNATGGALSVSDYTTGGSLASSPGLALATDGSLFVSDQTYDFSTSIASGPVKEFDSGGVFVGQLISDGASGLSGPAGMVINGDTLFTASAMNGDILKTDLTTSTTTAFASTGAALEAGVLAVLSDGSVITGSASGNGNIYHFGLDGTLLGTFASGLQEVGGIAAIPERKTYVTIFSALALLTALVARKRRRTSSSN
jgi:hypothetical protein